MRITIRQQRFQLGEDIHQYSFEAVEIILHLPIDLNRIDRQSIVYDQLLLFFLTSDFSQLLDGLNQKLSRLRAGVGISGGNIIPALHGQ